jgi:rhodanese-related sulfurtransferase
MNSGAKVVKNQAKQISQEPTISREEILARLHDPTLILVNVMPIETFQAGHIPCSIHLPVGEIEDKARKVFPYSGSELAVYCAGPT